MRIKQVGNKADSMIIVVHNPSTTVTIPAGSPVFFSTNATKDGLDVVNAETAGAGVGQNRFAGILTADLAPNAFGESVIFGIAVARVLTTATAIVVGDIFTVVVTAAANQITRSGAGAAMTVALPNIVAAQADATATGTSITLKVFVRP